jgi:hypothetical protein
VIRRQLVVAGDAATSDSDDGPREASVVTP